MSSAPFINVSWRRPFLPALIDIAMELTDGEIGKAFFVFPHSRPALYMTEAIRTDTRIAKPCILPRMESVTGLFSRIRAAATHGSGQSATPVGLLDQVALLLAVVKDLHAGRGGLLRDLPINDSKRFFPWGIRLANLMEEFFIHNLTPEDYSHMEGQVTPFAAALLENLGAIHARYVAALEERGWTTPGFDASTVVSSLAHGEDLSCLPVLAGKKIILAGFHTLTGSQRILFRQLWERHNAAVCLHADPGVVEGSPHWSCTDLVRWAGSWGTKIVPFTRLDNENDESDAEPVIAFRAGYDVHSQISELAAEFHAANTNGTKESRAVVLPDTGLLLPVLHHMPETDRNISMGYPLARSPLFRLIETALTLQEKKRGSGPYAYHWKTVIELLRHPYCKMLDPASGIADESRAAPNDFRRFLHHAERVVRNARRFETVTDLAARTAATMTQPEGTEASPASFALFERILNAAIFQWETIKTPDELATALQGIADLMHDHGAALWTRFPIDAECLYRLTESVIPQLAHTALKEENLPAQTLFAVLRDLLAEERVPFEAYPLVGDQVLGVLETRLLHFDQVFILDLTEDKLPGASGHNPLLPDPLRPLAGLPGKHGREKVAAYNFFRLINGARQVTLYWQEGVAPQGLNDAKKVRSRFVEELLWREEKKLNRVLTPEKSEKSGTDGPLRLISCTLPPVPRENRSIPMTEYAHARMQTLLEGDLSPSLLDAYLRCPAQFFYQRLARIREVEGVTEGRDPLGTGVLLHEVLRRFFASRLDIHVTADTDSIEDLRAAFFEELAGSELQRTLPADDRIMLEEAAPPILRSILESHVGRIPRYIEEKFHSTLIVDGNNRTLSGVVDRVDEYDSSLFVLDYKTGHVPLIAASVWQNDEFWQTLAKWHPGDGDQPFDALARAFTSVQLPAYVHMVGGHTQRIVHDAAYVQFRMGARDTFLFGEKTEIPTRKRAIKEYIPLLFTFLLRHMEHAEQFLPRNGQHCDWCLYKNLCMVLPR